MYGIIVTCTKWNISRYDHWKAVAYTKFELWTSFHSWVSSPDGSDRRTECDA